MKQFTYFLILFFCGFQLLRGQVDSDSLQSLRVDVVYLASDVLSGREPGTEGESLAASYIAQRMEESGLKPQGTEGSWYQKFDFSFNANPHGLPAEGNERGGKNVLGFIDNGAANTVVIGAHYDHLGMGEFGSRYVGEPEIHNGADDNASGVAVMLKLAEMLQASELKGNNYLFIAFSAEEMGLIGSKYYVNHPLLELEQVNYMINLDMVGRLNEDKVLVANGAGTSPIWKDRLTSIEVNGLSIKTTDSGIGPSDHTSFYLKDLPVLHFFTGQHTDYHKPQDDSPLINYAGMYDISTFIYSLIEELDPTGKIAFTKTQDAGNTRKAAAFKVSLGVMPDYVSEEAGMRIDAVMDGRPAQIAGLQDGDLVVQIGEFKVSDIYSYMEALSKFEAGDTVEVQVKRGDETLSFEVTF